MSDKLSQAKVRSACSRRAGGWVYFLFIFALLVVINTRGALPEKFRVLSVDLENVRLQLPGTPGSAATQELKLLMEKAEPDIVLLQGVADWESCERICSLAPGLRVLTCSAFSAKSESDTRSQVAILGRDRAILSWVEETADSQSFAFAIVQAGSRKLGIFSIQTPSPTIPGSEDFTKRILLEVTKLRQFPQNRPDSFLIGGANLPVLALNEAGFETATADVPPRLKPATGDFWISNIGFLSRPRVLSISGVEAPAMLCDVDALNPTASKFAYRTPLLLPGESAADLDALHKPLPAAPVNSSSSKWLLIGMAPLLLLGIAFMLRKKKSQARLKLVSVNGQNGAVLPVGQGVDPVRSNLLAWVKTQFVQRLLSQREQMIHTEVEATKRTLVIEEKLSQLQTALQDRIAADETRIQRLEDELSAATFENRDLIRGQIELLKEKLAKAKEEQSFRRN